MKVNGKITLLDLKGLYLSLGVEIDDDDLIDLLNKVAFALEGSSTIGSG